MKSFVCVLLFVTLVSAEPPKYRFRFAREESEDAGGESKSEGDSAPYPAAGYKPSKEFKLPERQELAPPATSYGTPDDSYSAPLNTYLAPRVAYGVPKAEGKSSEEKKDGEEKGDEDSESESVDSAEGDEKEGDSEESGEKKEGSEKKEGEKKKGEKKEKDNLEDGSDSNAQVVKGVYYVLLPGAQLQRVQFSTENDIRNMAYTARLQYKNEDRAPIYYYTAAVPQYGLPAALTPPATGAAYYQPW